MKKHIYPLLVGIMLLITLVPAPLTLAQEPDNPPVAATYTPGEITGSVCQETCIRQRLQVDLPQLVEPPVPDLDLALLVDITGSMGDELDSVKSGANNIVTFLRENSPNMRFAFATYADYPERSEDPADKPFDLVSPFTQELETFQALMQRTDLTYGGDGPETALFALYQLALMDDWRPDAVKVIAIFTDAPALEPDPGTEDTGEISFDRVIEKLNEKGIIVLGIQARDVTDTTSFLRRLARETSGEYFQLTDASEIPDVVIELTNAQLSSLMNFSPMDSSFDFQGASSGWLNFSMSDFPYPEDGHMEVDVEICPDMLGTQTGSYSFDIHLMDKGNDYGAIPVNFDYYRICSDLFIADTPQDDGLRCSDIEGEYFWNTPQIVVRLEDDEGTVTQFPRVGVENYVYVNVTNRGPDDARDAVITLYDSLSQFVSTFPADWQEVGRTVVNLQAEESRRLRFVWVPLMPYISLRATIENQGDPVSEENDVACDNNIAQLNAIPLILNQPSYESGMLGGDLSLTLVEFLTYSSLDFFVDTGSLSGNEDYVVTYLDYQTLTDWQKTGGEVTGGTLLPSGGVRGEKKASMLHLENLVGGPTVKITSRLQVVASSMSNGTLPIGIQAQDRIVSGSTIYYTVDDSDLPVNEIEKPDTTTDFVTSTKLSSMIPLVVAGILFLCAIVVFVLSRMGIIF